LWAARGAGVGFPGIVTRFDLRFHPLPAAVFQSTYVYSLTDLEVVSRWAMEVIPELPGSVELTLLLGCPQPESRPSLVVSATAFADTGNLARSMLAVLERCPAVGRATTRRVYTETSWVGLYQGPLEAYPQRHRYAADHYWTQEDAATVLTALRDVAEQMPSSKSHLLVTMPPRTPGPEPPGACFSMVARTFVGCYAVWDNEAHDLANDRWLERVRGFLAPYSAGHYVGETDLSLSRTRAAHCFSPTNWRRLQTLRRRADPGAVLHGFPSTD
jgi:FAD/FMN-containing dehydrogenase